MISRIGERMDGVSIVLTVGLFATGLFYEYLACFASVPLLVLLCRRIVKNGRLRVMGNLSSAAVLLLTLSYAASVLWAVDSGVAVIGFFKFLPVLLFMLTIMQQEIKTDFYLEALPIPACAMTVMSAVCMQVPALRSLFSVSGRLSGFFQYSNTFALYLLVCLVVVATKRTHTIRDLLMASVLLAGILYSGSRTVFVLTVISMVILLAVYKKRRLCLAALASFGAVTGAAALYAVLTGNYASIGRFLTTSLTESTFVGRLLYAYDAIPVILRHPFGLGYLGYYYIQNSIQTGVYTVRYVHNDFLQLFLDLGWIPAIVFIAAVIKSFFAKGAVVRKRLLLFVMTAHACFDMDLQFTAVFMLFVLLLDYDRGCTKEYKIPRRLCMSVAVAAALSCLYIGTALTLSHVKKYEESDKLYPWNTQNCLARIGTSDTETAEKLADKIIAQNGYVSSAYRVKGQAAFSRGDIAAMMENQKQSISLNPFFYDTYEEYARMLLYCLDLYQKAGDTASAQVCRRELRELTAKLQGLTERQSRLGKLIDDQPVTAFPEEIAAYE